MNKLGADRETIAVIWMITALGITGLILAWAMIIFYGHPYDVREIEARLLWNKAADCVSYAGNINTNIIDKGIINKGNTLFLDSCPLNFDTGEKEIKEYYLELTLYELGNLNKILFQSWKGNNELKTHCEFQRSAVSEDFSQCVEKTFNSFDNKNNQYTIKLIAAVDKSTKNVK